MGLSLNSFILAFILAFSFQFAIPQSINDISDCAQPCFNATQNERDRCELYDNPGCICQKYDGGVAAQIQSCVTYDCGPSVMLDAAFINFCVAEGHIFLVIPRTTTRTVSSHTSPTSSQTAESTFAEISEPPATNTAIPTSTETAIPTTEPSSNSSATGLSPGAKAGVAVGVALPTIMVVILAFLWTKRRKSIQGPKNHASDVPELSNDGVGRHELDSKVGFPKEGHTGHGPVEMDAGHGVFDAITSHWDNTLNHQYQANGNMAPAELDSVLHEPKSVLSRPRSTSTLPSEPECTIMASRTLGNAAHHTADARTSRESIPNTTELGVLLQEQERLKQKRRTLERLRDIQEEEALLSERIRTLQREQDGLTAEESRST